MIETKILVSYLLVCVTYSMCRLHYLLTQRADEEFNDMLDQLVDLSGNKEMIKVLILFQLVLAPVTAPFSMIKQCFKLIFKQN